MGLEFDYTDMKNNASRTKAEEIGEIHGNPDLVERRDDKILKLTWLNIEGFTSVAIYNNTKPNFHKSLDRIMVEARREIKIPVHLLGLFLELSKTITIDQLHNQKKNKSLVIINNMSLTTCAITLKFIEDLCIVFAKNTVSSNNIYKYMVKEYKKRMFHYLEGNGIQPKIKWFLNELEADNTKHNFLKKTKTKTKTKTKKRKAINSSSSSSSSS